MPSRRLPAKTQAAELTAASRIGDLQADSTTRCIFCERIARGEAIARNDLAVALADAYPVSAGHTLIIPARHEADFFVLPPPEQQAVYALLSIVKTQIDQHYRPDGYNVGLNVGQAAGQTVSHAHLHLIPRYYGDVADPRGGVRWVLPEHAAYWG